MSDTCKYPKCECPFDLGPDNLCVIGLPNTGSTPPLSAGTAQESDEFPVWHTCPECGSLMTEADPANSDGGVWYCGECGFNDTDEQDAVNGDEEDA